MNRERADIAWLENNQSAVQLLRLLSSDFDLNYSEIESLLGWQEGSALDVVSLLSANRLVAVKSGLVNISSWGEHIVSEMMKRRLM